MRTVSHDHLWLGELHRVCTRASTLTAVISVLSLSTLLTVSMSLDTFRKIVSEREGSVIIPHLSSETTSCSSRTIFAR